MPESLPPGFMPQDEAEALAELARDKVVLEVGSFLGRSTVAMARTAKLVVSVDHHQGNPEHQEMQFFHLRDEAGAIDTSREFLWNLKRFKVRDKVIPIFGDFLQIDWLKPLSFDMAFVDCEHDYETTRAAGILAAAYTKLHGQVVFHDYIEDWPEVQRAVRELSHLGPPVPLFGSLVALAAMQGGTVQAVPRFG